MSTAAVDEVSTVAVDEVSTVAVDEVTSLVERALALPANLRITLARRLLETLEEPSPTQSTPVVPNKPISELIGIAAGSNPPPDDETVKRWIHEYRMEKYGQ